MKYKKYFAFALLAIVALVLSACNLGTQPSAEGSQSTVVPPSPIVTQTLAALAATQSAEATSTPTPTSTAIQLPTQAPTNTLAATATMTNTELYSACPTQSLGKHPDSGQPLIFKKDPYPGVLCEYEIYFTDQDYFIDLSGTQTALFADWSHGKFWNAISGELLDACPTGAECEGVWVMNNDGTVPAGTIGHVYVYANGTNGVTRFLGTPNVRTSERKDSFACEYLVYSSQFGPHDNRNIRVPEWAKTFGSIYGHTGCIDFAGNPGESTVTEVTPAVNSPACEKPTKNDEWIWRQNEFWHYNGNPISFQVPNWIEKVLYEDNTNSNLDLTATNGQQVTNAVQAKAYCE